MHIERFTNNLKNHFVKKILPEITTLVMNDKTNIVSKILGIVLDDDRKQPPKIVFENMFIKPFFDEMNGTAMTESTGLTYLSGDFAATIRILTQHFIKQIELNNIKFCKISFFEGPGMEPVILYFFVNYELIYTVMKQQKEHQILKLYSEYWGSPISNLTLQIHDVNVKIFHDILDNIGSENNYYNPYPNGGFDYQVFERKYFDQATKFKLNYDVKK